MNQTGVVIVDLDGTVALNQHRYHLIDKKGGRKADWEAFFLACVDDLPNSPVIETVNALSARGYFIHIFSARGKIAFDQTLEWLNRFAVSYDKLTMREIGCYEPDELLKESWLRTYYPDYIKSVSFVIDDRDILVQMWRSLGLTCFQVAEGDF